MDSKKYEFDIEHSLSDKVEGSLKKSEMRWLQGTDIEDVYLILRMALSSD
jgi:hypothetical protein